MDNIFTALQPSQIALYPQQGQTLYLVVDGTQIEQLAQCLYSLEGELNLEPVYVLPPYDQLLTVSPYIIEATEAVKTWFFKRNNPTAGYFIASYCTLSELGRHYQNLITATSPYGSEVFLKMAHSECARVFFATESPIFWGEIAQVWLPGRAGWQLMTAPPFSDTTTGTLTISDKQWQQLGKICWENTLDTLAGHMKETFPHIADNQADIRAWSGRHADIAYNKGFTTERDLLMYLTIIGLLGEQAVADEQRYPDIYQLITTGSLQTPSQRIEAAADLAWHYFTQSDHSVQQHDHTQQHSGIEEKAV